MGYTVDEINLNNNGVLDMKNVSYGKTFNIRIKIGHKFYMVDIKKEKNWALVEMYNILDSDRDKFSKFDKKAYRQSVFVKPDAALGKDFFENIREISRAQYVVNRYADVLSNKK